MENKRSVINYKNKKLATIEKEENSKVTIDLPPAIGHIERNLEICAGCRTCEAVCSLSHEGMVSPSFARTWIIDYILEGRRIEGITCKQCGDAPCFYACTVGAFYIDKKTGARVICGEKCIGCQACIRACHQYPNSAIRFDPVKKRALKCDLCNGEPLCVKYCPEAALKLVKEST